MIIQIGGGQADLILPHSDINHWVSLLKADDINSDGVINSEDGYNVIQFGELHPGDIKYADIRGQNGDLTPDGVIDQNDEVDMVTLFIRK